MGLKFKLYCALKIIPNDFEGDNDTLKSGNCFLGHSLDNDKALHTSKVLSMKYVNQCSQQNVKIAFSSRAIVFALNNFIFRNVNILSQ